MTTHFTPPPLSVDAALARIDARTQAAHEALARARDFATGLERLRGRGRCGGVGVVVNHFGVLLEVTYPPTLTSTTPAELASATTSAVRAAVAEVVDHVAVRARETWGDDPLADQVVAEMTQRFAGVLR